MTTGELCEFAHDHKVRVFVEPADYRYFNGIRGVVYRDHMKMDFLIDLSDYPEPNSLEFIFDQYLMHAVKELERDDI